MELVHTLEAVVTDEAGRQWTASMRGETRTDGQLEGWLEFEDPDGEHVSCAATNGTKADLIYWADNLSPNDLDMALARARGFAEEDVMPPSSLAGGL